MFGLLLLAAAVASGPERDAALERGIRHVESGEWNQAIAALSDAVRRLSGDDTRRSEASLAHLYSGLAYVGLGQGSPAISQFAQALLHDPQVRLPEDAPAAAREAFEEARRETAIAAQPPRRRSPLPFIGAGVAAVGVAALVAAGGGSSDRAPDPGVPGSFTATSGTGTPQVALLSATPPSGSTIRLSAFFLSMSFVIINQANLPGRVLLRTEMLGPRGPCIEGRSEPVAIDRSAQATTLVVNAFSIACIGPFDTTTMNVRLIDADANIPVSASLFSGGYHFQP
jgi:hypothetical protein